MKRFNWNAIWFEIANNTVYSYGSTSLADQDVINAVIRQHPSILFEISCNWNVQLGDHTFSYQCYRNKSIKVRMIFVECNFVPLLHLLIKH